MRIRALLCLLGAPALMAGAFGPAPALAQSQATAAAAAKSFRTGVLDRFVGNWAVTDYTNAAPKYLAAEVRWRFNRDFLELYVKGLSSPSYDFQSSYELELFLGEAADGTIIAHALDMSGGDRSATLGRGRIIEDRVELRFPYPTGEVRYLLEYDRLRDRWHIAIDKGSGTSAQTLFDWSFERKSVP